MNFFSRCKNSCINEALLFFFLWFFFFPVQTSLFISASADGVFFPKSPRQLLSEKAINAVPYTIGVNNCEFGWVLPMVREL